MTVPPNTQSIVVGVIENKTIKSKSLFKSITIWCALQWKPILAEFIATVLLIIFGCMSCIPLEGYTQNPAVYAPLGFGLTVMFNIQIFGHISGAFMNPFVTTIAVIWGKIPVSLGVAFIFVECAGAILGYGFLLLVSPVDMLTEGICMTQLHKGINEVQGFAIELVLTIALSLINCGLWDPINESKQDSAPLKFGLTILGLSIAGGPLTGASMNPARSLGPAVWNNKWDAHWVYWAGPFIGGILVALLYKYTWLSKHKQEQDEH
ncbi:aquaporin AQPcic-like [Achroia grisella]|uniref:aquaporin AQPcic-like n=1 Tax=Achroia grisella TaxID=688607 RepID=UPI0027D252E4|nr:aquaporin AQPcic-like [Achroia grisella]